MNKYYEAAKQFSERAALGWRFGRVLAHIGEPITIEMDAIAYAESIQQPLSDAIGQSRYEPKSLLFGLLQYSMKNLLESFLNCHEFGLDNGPSHNSGGYPVSRINPEKLKTYTGALKDLLVFGFEAFEAALDRIGERNVVTLEETAHLLAAYYNAYYAVLNQIGWSYTEYQWEYPEAFNADEYTQFDYEFRKPVIALASYVQHDLKPYIASFMIHGSIADCQYVKGYSDLDTFAIISKETCSSTDKLLELRDLMKPLWSYFYAIDPLQHHGVMMISEYDTDYYAEVFAPFEMFHNARTIWCKESFSVFRLRDCSYERLNFLFHTVASARYWFYENKCFDSAFEVKWYYNICMLIPALYAQSKGKSIYKAYSFADFYDYWGDLSEIIKIASIARNTSLFNIDCMVLKKIIDFAGQIPWDNWLKLYHSEIHSIKPSEELNRLSSCNPSYLLYKLTNALWGYSYTPDMMFYGFPEYYSRDDYDSELENMYTILKKKYPQIADIYHFGTIKAPGISDLDIIIEAGVKNNKDLNSIPERWKTLNGRTKYLFIHEPSMVVSSGLLPRAGELYPIFSLRKLSNKKDDAIGTEIRSNKYHLLLALTEICFFYFIKDTAWSIIKNSADVRFTLMRLAGLNASLNVIKLFREVDPLATKSIDEIMNLRAEWFSLEQSIAFKKLSETILLGLSLQLYIIETLSSILSEDLNIDAADEGLCGILDLEVFFSGSWSAQSCLNEIYSAMNKSAMLITVLPSNFARVLKTYAEYDDTLSQQLKSRFIAPNLVPVSCDAVNARCDLISEHLKFLIETGLSWGGIPHFGFKPQSPAKNLADWQIAAADYLTGRKVSIDEYCNQVSRYDNARLRDEVNNGNYYEAVRLAEEYVTIHPLIAEYHYMYAFCLQQLNGDKSEIIDHYTTAINLGFDKYWVYYNRLSFYVSTEEWESAAKDLVLLCSQGLKDEHKDSTRDTLARITENLVNQNKGLYVIETLSNIELNQLGNPRILYLYAYSLHINGNNEEALKYYSQALENGFSEFWVRYNRGSLLLDMGKPDQAKSDLVRAKELDPHHKGVRWQIDRLDNSQ
jgi:hypothetical protein